MKLLTAATVLATVSTMAIAEEIRFAHWAKPGEAQLEGAMEFKRVVEAESDHTVTVFPGNQLGKPRDVFAQMALGSTQMLASGDPGLKEIEYLSLPYLMNGIENYQDVLNTDFGQEWNRRLNEERKVVMLGFTPRSPRQISANVVVNSIDDLSGLKLRAPERDYYVESLRALGANPTPMAFAEVYTALQTGVVDGQENPVETIYAQKFFEVQKGVAMVSYIAKPAYVVVSGDFWDGLSEDDKSLLIRANEASTTVIESLLPDQIERQLAEMTASGVTVTFPDTAPFIAATQSVRDNLGSKVWGDEIYQKIVEIGKVQH